MLVFICIAVWSQSRLFLCGARTSAKEEMITVKKTPLNSHFSNALSQEEQIDRSPPALYWTFARKVIFKGDWKDSSGVYFCVFEGTVFVWKQVRKVSVKMQWGGTRRTRKVGLIVWSWKQALLADTSPCWCILPRCLSSFPPNHFY